MSKTPHALSEDFPDQAQAIRELKDADPRFAKLVEEYDALNHAIHLAETNVEPTDELHEHDMRKQRMHMKDRIAQMLSNPVAG